MEDGDRPQFWAAGREVRGTERGQGRTAARRVLSHLRALASGWWARQPVVRWWASELDMP